MIGRACHLAEGDYVSNLYLNAPRDLFLRGRSPRLSPGKDLKERVA